MKETALRETKEEIGVDPISINIIGELTQVFVPPSNFLIHPFVGYCNFTPVFNASEREVKRIIEVNIEDLFKKDVIKIKKMTRKTSSIILPRKTLFRGRSNLHHHSMVRFLQ